MIHWRPLLDNIHIPWYDKGSNTSAGHVTIHCPWCGLDDPSHHLSINEDDGAFRCFRVPLEHAGRSTLFLLRALGVPSRQIDGLLDAFSDGIKPVKVTIKKEPASSFWDKFKLASEFPVALSYLKEKRKFENPIELIQKYDLRYTNVGRYAWRILLPLTYKEVTSGFSGRAIQDNMQPRYDTYDTSQGSLYLPAKPTIHTHTLVLTEGPFDALAITNAFPHNNIVAAGILGLNLSLERLSFIQSIASNIKQLLLVLDADQTSANNLRLQFLLDKLHKIPYARRFRLPNGAKDPAELTSAQIRDWFSNSNERSSQ